MVGHSIVRTGVRVHTREVVKFLVAIDEGMGWIQIYSSVGLALLWGIVAAGVMSSMSAYFATVLRLR